MEISRLAFFPRHTRITIRFSNQLYSSQVEGMAAYLLQVLPHLAIHRCVNRSGLPFEEELNDSELGHVFEHVILALLFQRGMFVRGQTTWNWQRDPIGTYHVTINTGKRLLVKECLLIAQAIFSNVLVGPPLRLRPIDLPPGTAPASLPFAIDTREEPERLLFSIEPERHAKPATPKVAGG